MHDENCRRPLARTIHTLCLLTLLALPAYGQTPPAAPPERIAALKAQLANDKSRVRWEDVVALADQCLYAAKASGRDVWVGVVQRDRNGAMPAQLDVRQGVQNGVFTLQHRIGRTIVWPDAAPQ